MKKLIVIAAMIAAFGLGTAAAFAASADKPSGNQGVSTNDQVCPDGDSGKIDINSGPAVTVTAPDGKLIAGYCVKAGSENQDLGPEFVTVNPPQKTVTITHSSGKDVSHYSLTYVDEGQTTTTDTTDTTDTTETTTTDTTDTTETTSTTETTTTTSTETTSVETTQSETAVASPASPENPQQVFTPPTQQVKSATSGPASSSKPVKVKSATQPSRAAQPAPFTP